MVLKHVQYYNRQCNGIRITQICSATQAAGTDTTCVKLGHKNWIGGSRDKSRAYTHYNFSSTSLLTDHLTHTMMQTDVIYARKLLLSCMIQISGVLWQSVLAF